MKRLVDAIGSTLFVGLLVGAVLFLLVPLVVAVALSFDGREYIGPFPPPSWSLRWYVALIENSSYADGLKTSLQLAAIATAVSCVAGTMAAVFIARFRFPGREALETFFLSPKFIPTVVVGFSLLILAAAVGITDGFTRLVAGHVIITMPFTIRAALAALVGNWRTLVEAAMILGAREGRAYFDVVLPIARTGVAAGALFAFVMSFDEVAVSLFLSDPFSTTLPVALVAEMRANLNLTIAAVSTIFVTVAAVAVIALDRMIGLDRVVGSGVYR
jgi:putative spermidine/putrescine transport system permease protein